MKRIDQMWAYDVMVEGFPVVEFYNVVHNTLKQGQWLVGQPETMPEFQAWLTPDGKGRISSGAFMAVSIAYYKSKYPLAADHNIAIAASVLRWAVTGVWDSLCLFNTQDYPLSQYCVKLVERCAPNGKADDQQSAMLFDLIENVVLALPRPEPDYMATIRQVVGMLAMTKGAFKSDLLADARRKLEALL